MEIIANAIYEP